MIKRLMYCYQTPKSIRREMLFQLNLQEPMYVQEVVCLAISQYIYGGRWISRWLYPCHLDSRSWTFFMLERGRAGKSIKSNTKHTRFLVIQDLAGVVFRITLPMRLLQQHVRCIVLDVVGTR
jgi:hypothetical protein